MPDEHKQYLREQIEMHRGLSSVYTERRYAPEYSRIFQRHWNESLCDLAELPAGAVVLDYGCGTGVLFPTLVERGYNAIGLDLSNEMLAAAENAAGVLRLCADGCEAPIKEGSLDAVMCRGSIHHVPDLEASFREIARVLKTGGVLAFSEPSNDSPINRLARRKMYSESEEFHEEDEGFRRHEIEPLLQQCGFEIEVSKGFGFFAYTLAGFPDKLDVLKKVPGNCTLTKVLIGIDRIIEATPLVNNMALHWQVRARKLR